MNLVLRSLIFNKSALQRGLFRSTSLKKYITSIQKNQSTAQDDLFMKPDPTKVTGMRHGSYDKLNDKGYVPEETVIVNGDIIIGKVSPIQPSGNNNKIYKDSSEVYKSHAPGVIDKVYTGIYNNEGYEMMKCRVRSMRTPTIGDKFCCFSNDHDVLTSQGWISIDKLTKEHKVACLVNGDTLEYHNPTHLQEYNYNGNMYTIKSNHVDLMVTPNHRMYIAAGRGNKKYKINTAENIMGTSKKYKKNVEKYIPTNISNKFILPAFKDSEAKELDMNAWLTFFGIWIAEGCVTKNWNTNDLRIATHKPRVKDALEDVCKVMNFTIRKNKDDSDDYELNSWRISDQQLVAYMKPLSVGAVNKSLPEWVWNLTQEQAQLLIKCMCLGDGHGMKNTITYRYDTSSKQLADDFQRLCLHAGWSTNIAIKYKAGHETIIKAKGREGEKIKSTKDAYRMSIITSQNEPLVNKYKSQGKQQDKWIEFNGKVYCCTVPGDGIIYVRRNGKPVWCGNSRHGQKGDCIAFVSVHNTLASLMQQATFSNCGKIFRVFSPKLVQ